MYYQKKLKILLLMHAIGLFRIVKAMFPSEIIVEILQNVNLYQLINLTTLNTFYNKVIKCTTWQHLVIINNESYVEYITSNYMFCNYKINIKLTVELAAYLNKCKNIYVGYLIHSEVFNCLNNCNEITFGPKNIIGDILPEYLYNYLIINVRLYMPTINEDQIYINNSYTKGDGTTHKLIVYCTKGIDYDDYYCVDISTVHIGFYNSRYVELFDYLSTNYTASVYCNRSTGNYYIKFVKQSKLKIENNILTHTT